MVRCTTLTTQLLRRITEFYLDSDDFNGISLDSVLASREQSALENLKSLVHKGLVEVYSSEYDFPHIKRLPAVPIDRQLESLSKTDKSDQVCLYPSTKYLRRVLPGSRSRSSPFSRLLALGYPQLKAVFFHLAVLERYQSDPRYVFRFDGLDGHISVKGDIYKSKKMGEADQVMLETFGLGTDAKGRRVIVAFLRYLHGLSARHQQHWQSYRIIGSCKIEYNYGARGIFGKWTEGISVYEALLEEISHINAMCKLIGVPRMFLRDYLGESAREYEQRISADKPTGFGLLMKPTKKAFLDFAHTLDKIISENLNNEFFAAQGLQLTDRTTQNGELVLVTKGSLRLLEEWLATRIRIQEHDGPAVILKPLREVRKLRQSPAHKFVNDEFSQDYQKKKETLM